MTGNGGRSSPRPASTAGDLGAWRPLPLSGVVEAFSGAPLRWWVSGGHALELHLGTSWRAHDDVDVGICRRDAPRAWRWLTDAGWSLSIAAAGRLRPWAGGPLVASDSENNVWCRRDVDGPWLVDVTVGEGDADRWRYRRDPAVDRPWAEAVLRTDDEVPYLAPELQLLFKSGAVRPKDDVDAAFVVPRLSPARRHALAALLPRDHPWQALIDGSPASDPPHG